MPRWAWWLLGAGLLGVFVAVLVFSPILGMMADQIEKWAAKEETAVDQGKSNELENEGNLEIRDARAVADRIVNSARREIEEVADAARNAPGGDDLEPEPVAERMLRSQDALCRRRPTLCPDRESARTGVGSEGEGAVHGNPPADE